MANNTPSYGFKVPTDAPSAPLSDQPPPYSSVVSGEAAVYPTQQPQPPYPTAEPHPGTGTVGSGYPQPASVGTGYPQPATVGTGYPHPQPQPAVGGGYPHPTNIESGATYTHQATAGVPVPGAVIVTVSGLGTKPCNVTCPSCGQWVLTRVEYMTSWHTHIAAGILCFATMFCSMCCLGLLPYCFNTFKDAEHYCPNCNGFIGRYSKC